MSHTIWGALGLFQKLFWHTLLFETEPSKIGSRPTETNPNHFSFLLRAQKKTLTFDFISPIANTFPSLILSQGLETAWNKHTRHVHDEQVHGHLLDGSQGQIPRSLGLQSPIGCPLGFSRLLGVGPRITRRIQVIHTQQPDSASASKIQSPLPASSGSASRPAYSAQRRRGWQTHP